MLGTLCEGACPVPLIHTERNAWGVSVGLAVAITSLCVSGHPIVHPLLLLRSRSVTSSSVTPWTAARQAPLSTGLSPGENTGVGCHCLLQLYI